MIIDASGLDYKRINEKLAASVGDATISGCIGQRFIAAGLGERNISIDGIPGNALGAYLNGVHIKVNGNAQDAVGDTMNDGEIAVYGDIGDAAGYAMRGGAIYIKGNSGYRVGVHMKEYKDKKPAIVVGGRTGSFLGEYQAGGIILVLGLNDDSKPIVGNFPGTGMHGGKLILRGNADGIKFPSQTNKRTASDEDMAQITPLIKRYCLLFGADESKLLNDSYTVVVPDTKNPYKQMYVAN